MVGVFSGTRPEERRALLVAFGTLFGVMTGHALLETARDALFLSSVPSSRLPWAYLGIAVVATAIAAFQQRHSGRHPRRRTLAIFLVVSAFVSAGFWLLAGTRAPWVFYAIYVWTGVFATIAIVQFWSIVGDLFTITQAKRIFGLIGTGGILGAIAGAGLARGITAFADARELLIAAALTFAATAVVPLRLRDEHQDLAPDPGGSEGLRETARRIGHLSYVRRLALIVLVSTVALTIVDFLFKTLVAQNVPAEELGRVFATLYLVVNVLSLVTVFIAGWVTRLLGVSGALNLFPALLLGGVAFVLSAGSLLAALVMKGIDGTFRYSLHRTAIEVLYVPVSAEIRARVKGLVDVVGQRGGQALGSLVILACVAIGEPVVVTSAITLALGVAWILLTSRLKPLYLDLFRRTLREGRLTDVEAPTMDLASLETLIAALNSPNDAEVVAALDLLREQRRVRLVPALILYHPSTDVVRRALDTFIAAGRTDFLPIADRLVGHLDPAIRAGILRARTLRNPSPIELLEHLADPSAVVRATALAFLLAGDRDVDENTSRALSDILEGESVEGKIALAQAISTQTGPIVEDALETLADDPDPRIRLEAARAIGRSPKARYLPALIRMLDRRELREEARRGLAALGTDVLPALEEALSDPSYPRSVRLHVPRTIARIEPSRATRVLLPRLLSESDGAIRYKTLRVLGSLKARNPEVPIDRRVVTEAIARTIEVAYRLLDWRVRLGTSATEEPSRKTAVFELLVSMLEHKERHAIDRLFRMLDLRYSNEDFRRIYRGLERSDRKARAGSRELVENLLDPPLRSAVLGLVDEGSDRERLRAAGSFYRPQDGSYEEILRSLLSEGGVPIQALVIFHVGELRLASLRAVIDEIRPDPAGLLSSTLERTRRLLSDGTPIGGQGEGVEA